MLVAGDVLDNPITGERLVVLKTPAETNGEYLELEVTWPRPGHRVPEHIHPGMEERWEVLEGNAVIRVDDREHEVGAGDVVVAPAGSRHLGWNPTNEPVRLRERLTPALRWLEVCEQFFALAVEGRMEADGTPDREAMREILRRYPEEIAPPFERLGRS